MPIIIGVDPDAQWILRMDYHITLEPSFFSYLDLAKGQSKVINNTLSIQENIYIDSCRNARVHYSFLGQKGKHHHKTYNGILLEDVTLVFPKPFDWFY